MLFDLPLLFALDDVIEAETSISKRIRNYVCMTLTLYETTFEKFAVQVLQLCGRVKAMSAVMLISQHVDRLPADLPTIPSTKGVTMLWITARFRELSDR